MTVDSEIVPDPRVSPGRRVAQAQAAQNLQNQGKRMQRGDHDVRSHVRMVRGGGASFTNPYFGCLGDAGLNDAALHIWSGWVSVTKAECESSTQLTLIKHRHSAAQKKKRYLAI